MSKPRALFLWVGLGLTAGCAQRLHLTESYAHSYREAFARQVANPSAHAAAAQGLDAQEAAAVVSSYRAQLAPRAPEDHGMLLLAPQAQAGGASLMPAPSVPPGR
jgi:hypothetical protein